MKPEIKIYLLILAMTALGLAFSNDVISNYFKDAYNVNAYQRGLIEFPREMPGLLCIFAMSILSFWTDIRISIFAQILNLIGITVLGLITPSFSIMLVFIFINSLGMHLSFPLQDSIGISLADPKKVGKRMGQFKGVTTTFQMIGAIVVFIGFRKGFFSFTTPVKHIFLLSGFLFFVVLILFIYLDKHVNNSFRHREKFKFIFRKEYKYYYILVVMYGVQKQIMMVYGPWVLIDILSKKADTIAILSIIGSFIGIFFIPAIGRWLDRFGVKKLLYADALSFIGVYFLYGFLSAGYVNGTIKTVGAPVFLAYIMFIIDRMSSQMSIVRTVYLKSIAVKDSDITPTLSLGVSMDHFVSIICAYLGGIVWINFGPQYIFFLAGTLSFINLYVAKKVPYLLE